EGATIVLYFANGNPLTLESILYGLSAGVLLVTLLLWFASFNRIMTSDKFIYLFGRIIPALSLVLSMSLRFVPKFKSQMEAVA
ncbi:MAG: energy-coupling factor transporter transmembrane protein EcfT, partial [Clostridia bacterium]|nr:energy-coupling factor transporter transmembrane protein EcfT [Clostridia bacterium]